MVEDKQPEKENGPTSETNGPSKEEKPKKKHSKVLWWVLIIFGALLLVPLFYAAWLGFVPGLSTLLGADKPMDLGVTYTEADVENFYNKTGQETLDYANAPLVNGKKVIFADPKPLQTKLTQEEITAAINNSDWAYMPIKNVQVRLSDNNRIEVSGNVDIDALAKFIPFIGGVGYSQADVDTGLSWLRRMAGSPAFYIDSTGSVINNQLNLTINSAQIGRWSAPLDGANKALTTATENSLVGTKGLDVTSATFDNGSLNFNGIAPTTVYVKSK